MKKNDKGLYRTAITINGKRKWFSGKTRKDVMQKIALYRIEEKESITFGSVAEKWQEDNWDRLRFGSYRTYAPCLERAVQKFGKTDIDKLKPIEIQTWLRDLGRTYAFKTVANHKSIVSQVCDYAIVNLGIDMYNPCDKVKMPAGLKKGTRNALSADERTAILSTTKDENQLAFLILFTGCRLGEALALQMKDIDMKNNVVHITKSVAFHGTADSWVDTEMVEECCRIMDIPLHIIKDANHSLETGDVDQDIKELRKIMKTVRDYAGQDA